MGLSGFFRGKLEAPTENTDLFGYMDTIQTWLLPVGMG